MLLALRCGSCYKQNCKQTLCLQKHKKTLSKLKKVLAKCFTACYKQNCKQRCLHKRNALYAHKSKVLNMQKTALQKQYAKAQAQYAKAQAQTAQMRAASYVAYRLAALEEHKALQKLQALEAQM